MSENESDFMSVPIILGGEFYKIAWRCDNKVKAQCQTCPSKIQGDVTSTGNFVKHLKRKHPSTFNKFEERRKTKRLKKNEYTDIANSSKRTTQLTLFQNKAQVVSKGMVDQLVLNYIVDEMRPISTVEKPSFIKLVEGLSGKKPNDRKTLKSRLYEQQEKITETLKAVLKKTNYVCTTADVWSSNNKSYLGMTVHFIESDTFERKSYILGCRRFKFSHTFDKIAEIISQIHTDYHLNLEKISGTVTDNASNFNKAFNVFASSTPLKFNDLEELDELQNLNDVDVEILPDFDSNDSYILLPQNFKCCAHTLNLIATTDAAKAMENSKYKKIYESAIRKAFSLWNLVSRSTKAADEVEKICSVKLSVPCPTRWNSMHDACVQLLLLESKLNQICKELKLSEFQSAEFYFFKEYVSVTKFLAKSIDILQGEKMCNLGTVLPTLFQLKKSLCDITDLQYCSMLKGCILSGLSKRFGDIMDIKSDASKPYLLATNSNPKFKLKWLAITPFKENALFCKKQLKLAAEKLSPNRVEMDRPACLTATACTTKRSSDEFFDFLIADTTTKEETSIALQCTEYFEDENTNYLCLNKYPAIKEVFLKFNCVTPSSAAVERLFSMGGQILTPRRNRLEDKLFETMLILKGNKI